MIGSAILLVLTISAIFAPLIATHDPFGIDLSAYREGPSSSHYLGTDLAGRDMFSRLLYAGRISLSVGLVAVSIYTVIGIILGALAGFYGGWVDSLIMRTADVVLSFPIADHHHHDRVRAGTEHLQRDARDRPARMAADRADVARANCSRCASANSSIAARAIGGSNKPVIFRHLLPNAMAPVIVAATFGIANAILLEAGLSFLGLGVQPPTPAGATC